MLTLSRWRSGTSSGTSRGVDPQPPEARIGLARGPRNHPVHVRGRSSASRSTASEPRWGIGWGRGTARTPARLRGGLSVSAPPRIVLARGRLAGYRERSSPPASAIVAVPGTAERGASGSAGERSSWGSCPESPADPEVGRACRSCRFSTRSSHSAACTSEPGAGGLGGVGWAGRGTCRGTRSG